MKGLRFNTKAIVKHLERLSSYHYKPLKNPIKETNPHIDRVAYEFYLYRTVL